MCIIAVLVLDIGETQNVELSLTTTTSGIDGKQNGPGQTATDETDDNRQFEVSEKKITIE